jgi:nitrile hydratase
MDGMHDLGGKQGFGPVRYTLDAPAFHAAWEVRANALYAHAVRLGIFNMDEYRHAIERMEPRHYVSASYYERTLTSLATLLVEKGVLTREELERRAQGAVPLAAPCAPGRSNVGARERFALGDRVRVRPNSVPGHMRLPGYIRGKTGVVVGESPPYPFPDAHAHAVPAQDEPTYDVRFRSQELWPDSSDDALVHVGVFQSYLERAPSAVETVIE